MKRFKESPVNMIELIKKYQVIFWDFDGVIKDSVVVKTKAYKVLFQDYGEDIQNKVQAHHELYGGSSRFEKIPKYFKEFLGIDLTQNEIQNHCQKFKSLVLNGVIESSWVPGVQHYLKENHLEQDFFIVTGTPQEEIEFILDRLGISYLFKGIWGAPLKKSDILPGILNDHRLCPEDCLMIGDTITDYNAAKNNDVDFLLRITEESKEYFKDITCPKVLDFRNRELP